MQCGEAGIVLLISLGVVWCRISSFDGNRPARNPRCNSGCDFSNLLKTREKQTGHHFFGYTEMPLQLLQSSREPLFLKRVVIFKSSNSCGIVLLAQQRGISLWMCGVSTDAQFPWYFFFAGSFVVIEIR